MNTKTLLMRFAFLAFFALSPAAFAADKETADSGSSSTEAALLASDEEFLQKLADDSSNDAYEASKAAGGISADEFFPPKEEEKPPVKYVYKGQAIGELRRSFKDDRIDDGYVQGLLQQRGLR